MAQSQHVRIRSRYNGFKHAALLNVVCVCCRTMVVTFSQYALLIFELLEFCQQANLLILNGRTPGPGDEYGQSTMHDSGTVTAFA